MLPWQYWIVTKSAFTIPVINKINTMEPQLSGPHLSGFLVNQTTEMTALLE